MAQTLSLPSPFKGQQDRLPVAIMESPYCEICENFNVENGILKVRVPDESLGTAIGNSALPKDLAEYSTPSLFQTFLVVDETITGVHYWKFYNVNPFTLVHTVTLASGHLNNLAHVYFNGYVYFVSKTLDPATLPPVHYTGSAWGNCGFTFPASFIPIGGCSFRNRLYFFADSAEFAYGPISAVASGTFTKRDLSGIVGEKSTIVGMSQVTVEEGSDKTALLAFVFASGEILMYSGGWPDSPDWALVKRYKIPLPFSSDPLFDAAGDTYVITDGGLISLKQLLSKGQQVSQVESITASITNRWSQIIKRHQYNPLYQGASKYVRAVYDSNNNRILVAFNNVSRDSVLDSTGSLRLVYDFNSGSWKEHTDEASTNYFLTYSTVAANVYGVDWSDCKLRLCESDTAGDKTAFRLRTAPLPTSKSSTNKISGIELITKSSLQANTSYKLIGDLGVETSASQVVEGVSGAVTRTFINVGIEATYVQLEINGTAGGDGDFEIYGLNVWYQPGGLR
jgi:hypothetical protein